MCDCPAISASPDVTERVADSSHENQPLLTAKSISTGEAIARPSDNAKPNRSPVILPLHQPANTTADAITAMSFREVNRLADNRTTPMIHKDWVPGSLHRLQNPTLFALAMATKIPKTTQQT